MKAKVIVNKLLETVDPAFAQAMQQATAECLADVNAAVFGGEGDNKEKGRRPQNSYDINCGLCEEWSERVRVLYREATGRDDVDVLDPGNVSGNPDDSLEGHVFLRFKGRFYDAECPEGVDDFRKLPLFTKQAEPDLDAPESNLDRYAKAIGAQADASALEILRHFRRSAIAYIKWANPRDAENGVWGWEDEDMAALRRAKTFAEAEAILAKYESEPSFLSMVAQGYFV